MLKQSWIIGGSTGSTQLSPRRAGFTSFTRRTCQNPQFSMTKIKWIDQTLKLHSRIKRDSTSFRTLLLLFRVTKRKNVMMKGFRTKFSSSYSYIVHFGSGRMPPMCLMSRIGFCVILFCRYQTR